MDNLESCNCLTCSNAVFDGVWGDYKCRVSKTWSGNPLSDKTDCKGYVHGEPATSKAYEEDEENE